tara:strand:+ start:1083 stop:1355 length:273 start_codon:yes stop_codon:yes gene_type:complete
MKRDIVGSMGISSMIQMMLETSKDFEGFDAITLTVVLNGKKLRVSNKRDVFTMSVKDIVKQEQFANERREERMKNWSNTYPDEEYMESED